MTGLELQEQFIELRASNLSYDKIAKQLKISKPTLIKWAKQFETDIANMRTVNMTALYEQYKISKQHKLEMWAEQLQAIRQELNSRGYKDMSTSALVDLLERFSKLVDESGRPTFHSEPELIPGGIKELTFTDQDHWPA
jgi:transposase